MPASLDQQHATQQAGQFFLRNQLDTVRTAFDASAEGRLLSRALRRGYERGSGPLPLTALTGLAGAGSHEQLTPSSPLTF